MSAMITHELKAKITDIFMQQASVKNFFMFEQIPADKLQNARNSFAPSIAADEAIIFLYDDTVFGSANDGFLLTTKHLFHKNIAEPRGGVALAQVGSITVKHGFLSTTITVHAGINELKLTVTQAENRRQKDALFQVLNHTVELLKNTRAHTTDANRPARSGNCQNCGAVCTDHSHRCEYCDSLL